MDDRGKKARLLCFAAYFLSAGWLSPWALDSFSEGERLFAANKPLEAIAFLETAVKESSPDEKAWLYLGVSYQQTGKHEDAVQAFRKGLSQARVFRHMFYHDMGLSYYALKKMAFAEEMFSSAIVEKPDFAPSYLNRANTRMNLKQYDPAAADFAVYLELKPDTPQRPQIEKVLGLLRKAQDDEIAKRAREEAERLAEEARKKALLDEVQKSLLEASEDTKNLSAGSGSAQGYEEDTTLE